MLSVNTYYPGRKENQFEPSKTLFLGDLSYFCTEEDIFNLFAQYGPIASIRVQRGVSGEPLLHGYIVFHSPVSARQAIMEVDGISFMGRKLRIQLGTIHHHGKEKLGFSDAKNFTQIHVSFICKRSKGFVVNEQVLRDIFTPFGEIADVAIKKHSRNPKQQRQTGYGFIYFVNAEDACRAVIALKNSTLHDITFDCNISHKSEHMIRSMLEPVAPPAHAYNHAGMHQQQPSGSQLPPEFIPGQTQYLGGGVDYSNMGRGYPNYRQSMSMSGEIDYNPRVSGYPASAGAPRPHQYLVQQADEYVPQISPSQHFFPSSDEYHKSGGFPLGHGASSLVHSTESVSPSLSMDPFGPSAEGLLSGTFSMTSHVSDPLLGDTFGKELLHFESLATSSMLLSQPTTSSAASNPNSLSVPSNSPTEVEDNLPPVALPSSLENLIRPPQAIESQPTSGTTTVLDFTSSASTSLKNEGIDEALLLSFSSLALPPDEKSDEFKAT